MDCSSCTSRRNIFLGFLAGVIATVTVHEIIKCGLYDPNFFPHASWSMDPVAYTGWPKIVSDALWGGLWGSIFALILGNVPAGSMTMRGALLGILGPGVLGVFILVPLITGRYPLFFDGEPALLGSVVLIAAGFGAATAWLYGFFTSGCRFP